MNALFPTPEPKIYPARKAEARVVSLFIETEPYPQTRPVDVLELAPEGLKGTRHEGLLRPSTSREPWYPRGTTIRNNRQVTILSREELDEIAGAMGLPGLDPAWIGANIVLEGVPRLSFLPVGTRLFFPGTGVLMVEGQNAPCRVAGKSIARNLGPEDEAPGSTPRDLQFPQVARRTRGLVASVERPGEVRPDMTVSVAVPEQWIWG